MTEFNEHEKAELLQFIQDNFSQQELESLAILTAMALNINIQGLNINQVTEQIIKTLCSMGDDEFNKRILDALTDKKKQKGIIEKIKKPEIQAEIRRPKSYVAPNTKASNELFGRNNEGLYMGMDKLKTEGKHSKKKITVALGITYKDDVDIGIRLSAPYTGTCLTAFDKVVHDAVVTLYVDGGNENITTNMIFQVISGNTDSDASKNPISKGLREAINESIDRMFHSWVKIDATEQAQIYGWDEGKYKGHLINCSIVEASLNGQVTVCAHVCEPPILYRYANDCGQVIRYDVKMLDVPSLENSVECIILKTYLLQQIQIMSHNKDFSRTIMFDTIYEMLNIQAPSDSALRMKKKQIRGHVIKCLDYWTAEKLIEGYEVKKTGKTLDRVTLRVKLVKKKFITG